MKRRALAWASLSIAGFVSAATCGGADPLEVELLGCVEAITPWETCAEFCEWDGAVCVESGCDGRTARAYHNLDDCVEDRDPVETELGCEDPLEFDEQPGGLGFYDCCCDYR